MTEDYSQPTFYRFNQDSLDLVRWVQTRVSAPASILDLGAGSGVIGIELARIYGPEKLLLVELQEVFRPHLELNLKRFLPGGVEATIQISSFQNFAPTGKFNLVVSNPPYYLPGRGELPADRQRAQARSFLVDSWSILLERLAASLAADGAGFVVLKRDDWLFEKVEREAGPWNLTVQREDQGAKMFLSLRLNVD